MKKKLTRVIYAIIVAAAVLAMFKIGMDRISIDSDIVESLPKDDPVVSDGKYVFSNHPVRDRIVIDIQANSSDPEILNEAAVYIEKRMMATGLFKSTGMDDARDAFPELLTYIPENLPILFSEKELEEKIKPLLSREKIRETMKSNYRQIAGIEGIGQADIIEKDPLGFRFAVLTKLASLSPSKNARIYKDHVLSADDKHMLVMLEPAGSGTDTALAKKISDLIQGTGIELKNKFSGRGIEITLTPVGSYRAALDNELTAKKDAQKAMLFATLGIALLLIVGFPRPFLGILALVPALAGTAMAIFVYSLFSKSISILAIGFGGVIISFTVDYGIAYLLFLDRTHKTSGFEATKEVWSLGLLAMLTTAGSFFFLFVSGFKALAEIGYFSALGVILTYIFVHGVFPFIFPEMPPAKREGFLPIQKFVNKISSGESMMKPVAAAVFGLIMLFFAKPDFRVDLASMNSVSSETLAAENLVKNVWGDIMSRLYVMNKAATTAELQKNSDKLASMLAKEIDSDNISSGFVSSMIFPGEDLAKKNHSAWKKFWDRGRISKLKSDISAISSETGFTPDAFDAFFSILTKNDFKHKQIPEKFYTFIGISKLSDNTGWAEFSMMTQGKKYSGKEFYSRFSETSFVKIFDPSYFSERIGHSILTAFIKMAVIVGIATAILAFLYLMDIKLTLVALAPTAFALVSTLGTMNLLGETVGIPAIMVTIIVIGMGSDYALYLVRAYQRYMDEEAEQLGLIRMTVFLSAASTIMGFGVMAIAEHSMLKHAGIALLLGIVYSYIGAIAITPPLLKRIFRKRKTSGISAHSGLTRRVIKRFSYVEPYPKISAFFQLSAGRRLPALKNLIENQRNILVIGCGYGTTASYITELNTGSNITAFEPDIRKRRIALRVLSEKTVVENFNIENIASGKKYDCILIEGIDNLSHTGTVSLFKSMRKHLSKDGCAIVDSKSVNKNKFTFLGNLLKKSPVNNDELIKDILKSSGYKIIETSPYSRNGYYWIKAV